jgi:methyl-accepting chemotaxis protein
MGKITLKKLVALLVSMSVVSLMALALTGFRSNDSLTRSRQHLSQVVLPLDKTLRSVAEAVTALINRHSMASKAETIEILDRLENRDPLEQRLGDQLAGLEKLGREIESSDAAIKSLAQTSHAFLESEKALENAYRSNLLNREEVGGLLVRLDQTIEELQRDSEAISGKINFAVLRKQLDLRAVLKNPQQDGAVLASAVDELLQGNVSKAQKACGDLRIATAMLTGYARQVQLTDHPDRLVSLENNKIVQTTRQIENAVATLKGSVDASLQPLVDSLGNNVLRLREILQTGERSIIGLRMQWFDLHRQNDLLLENFAVNTAAVTQALQQLGELAHQVDRLAEKNAVQSKSQARNIIIMVSAMTLAFMVLGGWSISRRIVMPIQKAVAYAGALAEGDFSQPELPVNSGDEIAVLSGALNSMAANLRNLLKEVSGNSALILSSSTQLSSTSEKMTQAAEAMRLKTTNVAASAQQVNANITCVSETADNMTATANDIALTSREMVDNVNSVAAAVEEMSASIQDVAASCSGAHRYAARASERSAESAAQVAELHEAAVSISQVVEMITDITDQTKLLALNATIEAARAGEAGKGFAVVASEVKNLARQTAEATGKIVEKIKTMQEKTQSVVQAIQEISTINQEMSEVNSNIAAAVEEQSATAGEIARTVNGTAQRVQHVSEKMQGLSLAIDQELAGAIKKASSGVSEITLNIHVIDRGVQEAADVSAGNSHFAGELADIATDLGASVGRFRLDASG